MSCKFKVGDVVENIQDGSQWELTEAGQYLIGGKCIDSGRSSIWAVGDSGNTTNLNLYKVAKIKKLMSKVSIMMKKLLDSDTQTLVKAGYINGDLELTSEGEKALLAIVFTGIKADLVKSAQESLDEEAQENA